MNISNQKGQALVELALTLMLLFTLVFGIFEIGRAMYITNLLNNAAREGARRAAVSPSLDGIFQYVSDRIPLTDKTGLQVDRSTTVHVAGEPITITVTLPFQTITRLPILDNINLHGTATMRFE